MLITRNGSSTSSCFQRIYCGMTFIWDAAQGKCVDKCRKPLSLTGRGERSTIGINKILMIQKERVIIIYKQFTGT